MAVIKIARAAGLNKCFLLMLKIYFEVIARIPAKTKNGRSAIDLIGVIIKANIKAVIRKDSKFVCTLKALAKTVFVIQQTITIKVAERTKGIGLNGKSLNEDKLIATSKSSINTYRTKRYIVIPSNKSSIILNTF